MAVVGAIRYGYWYRTKTRDYIPQGCRLVGEGGVYRRIREGIIAVAEVMEVGGIGNDAVSD